MAMFFLTFASDAHAATPNEACDSVNGKWTGKYAGGMVEYTCDFTGWDTAKCQSVGGHVDGTNCKITMNEANKDQMVQAIQDSENYAKTRCSGANQYIDASGGCMTVNCPAGTTYNATTHGCDGKTIYQQQAQTDGNHDCGVDTFFSWGCTNGKNDENITPMLIKIINWLAIGVTIAVIAGIIFGAVQYTTSGGNSAQAQKAIGLIRNAVIALILYFAMWALLNFLVPGGLFSS